MKKRRKGNSRKWAEVSTLNCSIVQPPNQAWVIYVDSLRLQTFSFDKLTHPPLCIYQSDLATLCAILVEKILQAEKIPKGGKGYYFATPSFQAGALGK